MIQIRVLNDTGKEMEMKLSTEDKQRSTNRQGGIGKELCCYTVALSRGGGNFIGRGFSLRVSIRNVLLASFTDKFGREPPNF